MSMESLNKTNGIVQQYQWNRFFVSSYWFPEIGGFCRQNRWFMCVKVAQPVGNYCKFVLFSEHTHPSKFAHQFTKEIAVAHRNGDGNGLTLIIALCNFSGVEVILRL